MIRYLKPIVMGIFFAYIGALLWQILTNPNYLWDFRAYHVAASAQAIGLNPYDTDYLRRYYNFVNMGLFEFVYPPVILILFKPLILLSYEAAAAVFVAIKLGMMLSLIYLWQRYFFKEQGGVLFWLFVFFAFNSAVWVDFSTGNVSIIEQFCLWWAFYFWRKDRLGLFGAAVLAASMFKLVPIVFLGLLLFSPNRYRWRYLVGFGGLFGLIMGGSYLIDPALFREFIRSVGQLDERGVYNPTFLSLVRDLSQTPEGTPLNFTQLAICGIIVLVIGVITYRPLRQILQNVEWPERSILLIFLACFVHAVVMLRFKNYSYILLIPGTYYLIGQFKNRGKNLPYVFWLAILMLPSSYLLTVIQLILPNGTFLSYYIVSYYGLWLNLVVWGLYLYYLRSLRPPSPQIEQPEPVLLPELERSV